MLTLEEQIGDGLYRTWILKRIIAHKKTRYQDVVVAETKAQGIGLFCNNERESTEFSQQHYHECSTIPALSLCPNPEKVLVIGCSEGVIPLLLEKWTKAYIDHVDIDLDCVKMCAEHLPYGYDFDEVDYFLSGNHPRIKLHHADGKDFITTAVQNGIQWDIICMDLVDESNKPGVSQQNRLYEKQFLERWIVPALTEKGVFITQAGCPTLWRNTTLKRMLLKMKETFGLIRYFDSTQHEWAWIVGSKAPKHPSINDLSVYLNLAETLDMATFQKGCLIPKGLLE